MKIILYISLSLVLVLVQPYHHSIKHKLQHSTHYHKKFQKLAKLVTKFRKSRTHTHTHVHSHVRRLEMNDDDRVAYGMIDKLEAGDKTIKVMIKKTANFQSMNDLHSLDYEELCKIKQGYVLRYIGREDKVLQFSPVFVVLNKDTLSLYENENINSLITSYLLSKLKVSENKSSNVAGAKNMKCLKLSMIGDSQEMESVCLDSSEEERLWKEAIKNFGECQVEQVSASQQSKNIKISKDQSQIEAEEQADATQEYVQMRQKVRQQMDANYENERDQMRSIIQSQDQKRNNFIQSLRQQYTDQIDYYKQEQSQIETQIKQQREKTKKMMEQQDCVQLQMEKDLSESESQDVQTSFSEVNKEQEKSQKELLEQIKGVFKGAQAKVKKLADLREQNEKDEQAIIQSHEIQEVNRAYSGQMQECYNKRLGDPETREEYINERCKSLVATKSSAILKGRIMSELENCMDESNFCNVCCVTNAGVTGGARMSQCMDKCDDALQSKVVPEMTVNLKLQKLRDPTTKGKKKLRK